MAKLTNRYCKNNEDSRNGMELAENNALQIFTLFDDTSDELSEVEKEIWKKIASQSIKDSMLKDD